MRKVRKRHQIFYLPYSVSNNLNNLIYKQNEMNYKRFIDSKFSSVGGANLCKTCSHVQNNWTYNRP